MYLAIFLVGQLLERMRLPWIFSGLLIGLGLSLYNPFVSLTSSDAFGLLAELGMFFLLFIIGFEIDFKTIKKQGSFIFKTTAALVFTEALFGTLLLHYLFVLPWDIAIIVALSFATIGEAALLPILDEFKLTRTKLGQIILGVGIVDDFVEVLAIVLAIVVVGAEAGHSQVSITTTIGILLVMFGLAFGLTRLKHAVNRIKCYGAGAFFLFVIAFILLFVGIGGFTEGTAALGAIIGGIALKNFLPLGRLKQIESELRTIAYGFFAPLFFLSVGLHTDVSYIFAFPLLVVAIMLVVNATKIGTTYFMARKDFGIKNAIVMGISFSIKLSTSIVVIAILYNIGLINLELYSVLIGSQVAFTFVVPLLLSYLIPKWGITGAIPN